MERLFENEERNNRRKKEMDFKHAQLLKQQEELMFNIENLLRANTSINRDK